MKNIGKVFISHSSADKIFVDHIVADIIKHGIDVWYDKFEIRIGDSIPGKINEGLSESKYFIIVLSKHSVNSKWVQEELNAALVKQIALKGTFLLPVLIDNCHIPPLLSHRHCADFRQSYDVGIKELFGVWGLDSEAIATIGDKTLFPWPDVEILNKDFVYLHSTRFDKFFRMSCDFNWTANNTIEYLVKTLKLPWNKEIPELGMRWSFSYGLNFFDKSVSLEQRLVDAGIQVGGVLKLNISGTYEDLYEKELHEMWDGSKLYEMGGAMMRDAQLKQAIQERGHLSTQRLREISNSCFNHV
jgi:hypothetical protein